MKTMLFPPLNKRNTRDKAQGLRITSEGHIGELGVRCLSIISRDRTFGSYHREAVGYAVKDVNKRAKVLKNSVPL